ASRGSCARTDALATRPSSKTNQVNCSSPAGKELGACLLGGSGTRVAMRSSSLGVGQVRRAAQWYRAIVKSPSAPAQLDTTKRGTGQASSSLSRFRDLLPSKHGRPHDFAPRGSQHLSPF